MFPSVIRSASADPQMKREGEERSLSCTSLKLLIAESMKTRKLILKAGGFYSYSLSLSSFCFDIASARKQEIAAKEVAKTNDSVMQVSSTNLLLLTMTSSLRQRYKELKKFTKKSKITRKEISQKVTSIHGGARLTMLQAAWLEGAQYLINQEQVSIFVHPLSSSMSVDSL
jgi:hypothetical protein